MPGLIYPSAGEQALHNANTDQDELSLETALVAFSTSELVEKLCLVNSEGHRISALRAASCGIAFLATTPTFFDIFAAAMRHVRSVKFHSDIVTNSAYSQGQHGLVLLSYDQRRVALGKAICQGLFAKFLASARDLEDLDVNLFCHEIRNPDIDESDLEDFLGTQHWLCLARLDLQGLLTSEQQLIEFLARHRDTLRHLTIRDILLKSGTLASLFHNLRNAMAGSQLVVENFHLGGSFTVLGVDGLWPRRWSMDANITPSRRLGDHLASFILGEESYESLQNTEL